MKSNIIKRFTGILVFLMLATQINLPAYATTGACSGHDGVNCSVGADSDGSVICKDGWTDSSVDYISMKDECGADYVDPSNAISDVTTDDTTTNNLCNTTDGSKGFIMSDGKCYAPGENVPETDCIVSETGGCKSLDFISEVVKEQVKCVFYNSNQLQKCNSPKGSCSGIETCIVDITGQVGEKITWKSSCGGYAYTTIDGNAEHANFKCAEATTEVPSVYVQPIVKEQVKCVFLNSSQLQKCYTLKGSCSGIDNCAIDVAGWKGEKITWKSSCGGYAYTTIDGNAEHAEFKCAEATTEEVEYPPCQNPPKNSMISSCIDKIINGERIERYKFNCISGYARSGNECVRLTTVSPTIIKEVIPPAGYEDEVITAFYDYNNPFPDTDTNDLEGMAAAELYRRAVLGGYPDGEFKGWKLVNRAESAKFLLLARFESITNVRNDGKFRDILDNQWYTSFVVTAAQKGIINGYPDGTFQPARTVNTAEFLKMLTLTFDLETYLPHSYSDVSDDEWFAMYVGIAQKYNLFPDRDTAKLEPSRTLTRKEVAIAIYQYLFRK